MIAAGRGDYAGPRDVSGQQVGECTPGLERARVLQKLELEAQTGGGQPEICRIDLYDRGPSNLGPDQPLSLGSLFLD